MRYSLLIIVSLLLTPIAQAQDSSIKQFELFTNCQPLSVHHIGYVSDGGLTDDAKAFGPTIDGIQNTLGSRLRSARLYKEDYYSYPALLIKIMVVNDSVYMNLQLRKVVYDEVSEARNAVSTWSRDVISSGGDSIDIMSSLSGLVDEFLVEYLRENEAACD